MEIKLRDDGTIELTDFSATQAFKIACKLERDGLALYEKMFRECSETAVNSALEYLIQTEKEHLHFFESELEKLEAQEVDGFEEDDFVDYMDSHVFDESAVPHDRGANYCEPSQALLLGLRMEQRALIFYRALREQTNDTKAQAALDTIINEEQKHMQTLEEFV